MNYFKLYDRLVAKRQSQVLDGEYETHHIVPKCMGGSDDQSNLVRLTYREHLIAHVLLSKIHPDSWGLSYAVYMMCAKANISSRAYDASKRSYIEKHRERTLTLWQTDSYIEKQSFRTSDEFRQSMSDRMKQVYADDPSILERMKQTKRSLDYSLIWTDERKQKISDANKGVKKPEGFGDKISKANTGRVFSDEWKANLSKAKMGKGTGDANAMSDPEKRAKVGQSKIGRKLVSVNGTRRYLKAEEYELIKDDIKIVDGKLYYTS